jgi:hypothetical protein
LEFSGNLEQLEFEESKEKTNLSPQKGNRALKAGHLP